MSDTQKLLNIYGWNKMKSGRHQTKCSSSFIFTFHFHLGDMNYWFQVFCSFLFFLAICVSRQLFPVFLSWSPNSNLPIHTLSFNTYLLNTCYSSGIFLWEVWHILQCLGITPGDVWGQDIVPGIKPGLAMCKTVSIHYVSIHCRNYSRHWWYSQEQDRWTSCIALILLEVNRIKTRFLNKQDNVT